MRQLLVFTDLDGSLLDHHNYSWEAARTALQRLRQLDIPVVFNTSKTLEEVRPLQDAMGIRHPFITENGMITTVPAGYFEDSDAQQCTHFFHGQPYRTLRRLLSNIRRQYEFRFIGFGDCTPSEVVELTGLTPAEAEQAGNRKASEPLVWQDSEEALEAFVEQLEKEGLHLNRGGRFYHVCGKGDKGSAATRLIRRYQASAPRVQWQTIGLGDGMNDLPMLNVVDYPVLIRSDHGSAPVVDHLPDVLVTDEAGPRGWNQAVHQLLDAFTGKCPGRNIGKDAGKGLCYG